MVVEMKNSKTHLWIILICLLGFISACQNKNQQNNTVTPHKHAGIYTCPMHPQILRDKPGDCPICGMALVKKGGGEKASDTVNLGTMLKGSSVIISSIPVTAISNSVEKMEIDALGYTAYNMKYTGTISARISGRIEKLYLRYNFQDVMEGQRVMDIYSPELLTAQQNLLFLVKNDPGNSSLINISKEKLRLLGVTSRQLNQIITRGKSIVSVSVYSNYSGHIHEIDKGTSAIEMPAENTQALNVKEGMYVQRGEAVFSVYNPHHIWVLLNIYANQQALVNKGQTVQLVSEVYPGKIIEAKIDYIEPVFRDGSKTITARVNIDNSRLNIPVGSQMKAKILANTNRFAWLPAEAIVSLGQDKVVFVKSAEGFKPQRVETGLIVQNKIQILKGLTEKDSVAANAQFLIDSESFIKVNQ